MNKGDGNFQMPPRLLILIQSQKSAPKHLVSLSKLYMIARKFPDEIRCQELRIGGIAHHQRGARIVKQDLVFADVKQDGRQTG